MIKMFNYGVVHDVYTLHEYCHNCGYCPTCVIGEAFGTAEKSTFKKTKARKYYNKAKSLGHPYAEFMLRRANIVSGGKAHYTTGLVSTSQTDKLILKRLKKHVDNQDAVATFMYYFLKTNLVIRPDSARWFTEKNEKIIKTTISLLEKEAKEGRILAMFYLGITYRLQQDYKKSFAWFYLADCYRKSEMKEVRLDDLSSAAKCLEEAIRRTDDVELKTDFEYDYSEFQSIK